MNTFTRFAFSAVFCHVVGVVLSADTSYYAPGMRVKWGEVDDEAARGVDYFFDIALTGCEAESRDGWVQVELPCGTPYESVLTMRCPADDYTFCAFYDEYDYFAGLQVSVPVNGITNPVPTDQMISGAILWTPPATDSCESQDYWTYQLFIVDDESLEKTQEEREALRAAKNTLLYNDALWISDTDYYSNTCLRKLTDVESDLPSEQYSRQRCYLGMGRHYYYQLESRRSCTNSDPWFPLISSGGNQIHGIGFTLQAIYPDPAEDSGLRTWFEHQTVVGVNYTVPDVPRCDLDLAANDNLRTIHMHFISEPWKIECPDETDFQIIGLTT